jgi:hypothetical protein
MASIHPQCQAQRRHLPSLGYPNQGGQHTDNGTEAGDTHVGTEG